MSDTTTRDVRVRVWPTYLAEHSVPNAATFVFAYHISIANLGRDTVQLLRRHWIITDALGHVEEVEGEGVVGETPVLPPGTTFEYDSFCPLPTPFGTMQGAYTMRTEAGDSFLVEIGQFSLIAPQGLN